MPRYYFNVFDGRAHLDEDGVELPDMVSARREAIRSSGNFIRELGPDFWTGEEWRMEVTDANGMVLFCLNFSGYSAAAASPIPVPR